MATLPKHHAPVREAVASILGPVIYLGNLYDANQTAEILNATVADSTKGIDATTLLRAFSNDNADTFMLPHPDDRSVVYVCWKKVSGRHGENDLAIDLFVTMAEAQRTILVRWRVNIADEARSGLVEYLRMQKSKQPAGKISRIGKEITHHR